MLGTHGDDLDCLSIDNPSYVHDKRRGPLARLGPG